MAVLRKRQTKRGFTYDVDFRYNGKRYIISTKTSDRKIATHILNDIQGKIARGNFNLLQQKRKDIRLSSFAEKYLEEAVSYKSRSTVNLEKIYLKKLQSIVGDLNIRSVNEDRLIGWKKKLSDSGLSPATFNMERRTLHAVFNVAKKWGYIDANPFTSISKVKPQEKRLHMMDDELVKFFACLDDFIINARCADDREVYRRFRTFAEFLLNTGLRRNEALNLRPDDIDLKRRIVAVHQTKDKELRLVPANAHVQRILKMVGDKLFSDFTSEQVTRIFARIAKKAGLNGFHLHSLRHTYASALIARGVDLYTVSRLLGHSDLKTTMVYAKVGVATLQSAMDKLDLDAVISPKVLAAKTESRS